MRRDVSVVTLLASNVQDRHHDYVNDHLEVRLEAPEFAVEREPIRYAVVVENSGDAPLDLHLQGREILFDLAVIGEGGGLVWRRLHDSAAQAILRLETLDPGETIRLEDSWDQRGSDGQFVEPGFYTLQATLPTDGAALLTQDRLLQITGRER